MKEEKEKPSYIAVIDRLEELKDLITVCVLAHETAAQKGLPIAVIHDFALREIDNIKEMVNEL